MKMSSTLLLLLALSITSCASQKRKNQFSKPKIEKSLIKNVTTKQDVINEFGSPQMVNSDSNGLEHWVYDYSRMESSGGSIGTFGLGFVSTTLTGIDMSSHNSSSSRKSTTLSIAFMKNKVKSYNIIQSSI